ncbi:DUF2442 domain-containing protein [Thiocystis violascens]|uniref:DUF2442 domain-containing protein n=1 Tax=Thiocystis violascens (strain ATCC 17096 / DSM 198 / 6111) TaxID=765911 RepID=I3Y9G5_THIV6|nr:DUF2442 domain-containing protein [Thiocystis violascens]AFL73633.1 Protein of unknown function (DUF2442) [Thiocystis violascens DSM 198]
MRIAEIIHLENHVLLVASEDGAMGLFDIKPYLTGEVFAALQDDDEFTAVHNGGSFIEWACSADLSADTIEAHLIPAPPEIVQQFARRRHHAARSTG